MSFDSLNSLSALQLYQLQEQVKQKIDQINCEIKEHHTETFIESIGLTALAKLPKVSANQLQLHIERKYPQCIVKPDMLDKENGVRGIDGLKRPFIALKIDLLETTTLKKVTTIVEVIFKAYSLDKDGKNGTIFSNTYWTALVNQDKKGQIYTSGLYSTGAMRQEQMQMIGRLLNEETVPHLFDKRFMMRLASIE
ncbi:MAG: hypothetical protein Tsb0021_08880 [Chlamydiales bacterium]